MLSLIFENLYLEVLEINLIFKVGFYSIDKSQDILDQVNNKFRNSIK
jgi:hypothetical protein